MSARPRGAAPRRAIRRYLPQAHWTAAQWIRLRAEKVKIPEGDQHDAFYAALLEVAEALERKADWLGSR